MSLPEDDLKTRIASLETSLNDLRQQLASRNQSSQEASAAPKTSESSAEGQLPNEEELKKVLDDENAEKDKSSERGRELHYFAVMESVVPQGRKRVREESEDPERPLFSEEPSEQSDSGTLAESGGVVGHGETSSKETATLNSSEYKRYGRQLILPQIGLDGQLGLRASRVLIVGLGGLGCPAAMYLAGAGVGFLGLMDGDTIEISNLHRQLSYATDELECSKAESLALAIEDINPNVEVKPIPKHLTAENALKVVEGNYDLILDCTDHPSSRYLISDLAVIIGVPLVSGSALKTDGQLLVLNNPPSKRRRPMDQRGFCYRCVFPRPPPPETLQSCGEGGILGPVVGVMGTLMATEAIKILSQEEPSKLEDSAKTMLLYSAYSDTPFRTVRLPGKRKDCPTCSWPFKIDRDTLVEGSLDYEKFCGTLFRDPLPSSEVISARNLNRRMHDVSASYILIDVREKTEYGLCHLPTSKNIPLSTIRQDSTALQDYLLPSKDSETPITADVEPPASENSLIFICRYGNDSQDAVKLAKSYHQALADREQVRILDVKGGLKAWKDEVNPQFPEY